MLGLGRFHSFWIVYIVGRIPWAWDQPVARPLLRHRTTQTQNKRTQTSMSCVGFEPTILAFERAKTVHASDCAATVTSTGTTLHLHELPLHFRRSGRVMVNEGIRLMQIPL
jgi:hypothetical protein